jgi:hypothetical protein
MLDKKTINALREKRRRGATYPELSKSYGIAISTIEYWVGDIKPAKFTYFGWSDEASQREPVGPSSVSKRRAEKWDNSISYLVEFANHQSEDGADVKKKLDEVLAAIREDSSNRVAQGIPSLSDKGDDGGICHSPAETQVVGEAGLTAPTWTYPTSYATMSKNQRICYGIAALALMRNDYETAKRAAMLYYLEPLLN